MKLLYSKGDRPRPQDIDFEETVYNIVDKILYSKRKPNDIFQIQEGALWEALQALSDQIATNNYVKWSETSMTEATSKVAQRDTAGDIFARLFRSSFGTQTSLGAGADICFRNNDSSDSYMRFVTRDGLAKYVSEKSGNFYSANESDTYIVEENVLGDTGVGVDYIEVACFRIGEYAVVSLKMKIINFSRAIPSDASTTVKYDVLRRAKANGWFNSMGNAKGIGSMEFAGSGFDYAHTPCGLDAEGSKGLLNFYMGETSQGGGSLTADNVWVRGAITFPVYD
ncbi:MAG: hypothetical protein KAH30_00270 [Caldisericia bacterium]|nr:hypothetical protein [Caldisericia bacterium]